MDSAKLEKFHIQEAKLDRDPTSILTLQALLASYCLEGNFDKAKALLEELEGIVDVNYDDGYLITLAAFYKNWDMFDFLLDNGADLECCHISHHLDPENEELVKRLVAHGLDPEILKCKVESRGFEFITKYRRVKKE